MKTSGDAVAAGEPQDEQHAMCAAFRPLMNTDGAPVAIACADTCKPQQTAEAPKNAAGNWLMKTSGDPVRMLPPWAIRSPARTAGNEVKGFSWQ